VVQSASRGTVFSALVLLIRLWLSEDSPVQPFVLRTLIPALLSGALLISLPAANAAPTCQTREGETIRCATPGAMPVGWKLPLEERLEKERLHPPKSLSTTEWLELFCVMGLFFALLALMPDFEGDWDRQEDDKKRR